jgi:signal transduction histidine kinase
MTLRKKLFILMAGMVVFPFLASGFTMLIVFSILGRGFDTSAFLNHAEWMFKDFDPAVREGRDLPSPPNTVPSVPFVFLSPDNVVVLSNFDVFPAGARAAPEEVFAAFSLLGGANEQWIISERLMRGTQFAGTTFAVGALEVDMFEFRESILLFYVVFSLVLGLAVGGARILRNIRRSIAELEAAAKKIAAGNYDFRLVPRGRDEFTALTQSFETMRGAIKENSAQRSRFLMAVSHDLKTPLTSIRGYIEALEDGMAEDEEARDRYLGIIRGKTEVLEERIFELIDFVRMQTGDWRIRHTVFGLKKFLEEISAVFGEDAAAGKKAFSARLDIPASEEVRGDMRLLHRVFENLFGNALRYSEENGRIELSARMASGGAEIRLFNSGRGVAPEELELIFEPFYRGSSSRREPGFGLGLSTARSILEGHGWTIHAEAGEEGGVCFVIWAAAEQSRALPE